jgi:hypothetical protein
MSGGARPFLRLEDFVLPPPLPALVALLIVCGLAYLGWLLALRLRRGQAGALDAAAAFVVVTALTAAAVHALALAQLSTVRTLRPVGWILAACGVWALIRHHARLVAAVRREIAELWALPRFDRAGAILAGLALVALALAALGPPTDADSLDYHLGVPLDWLRHGGAYPRPDWFTSRLVGLAESLNLLGVASGTDCLGAVLQLGGLVTAAMSLRAVAATARDRLVAWLLTVACPVVVFLVPNQKPQMLPVAAMTAALIVTVVRFSSFRASDAILAFTCAAFAAASKISYLLSVGIVVLVCLAAAWRSRRLGAVAGVGCAAFALILLPVLGRNTIFYGDPISPFLERFRHPADPALVNFAAYLRAAYGEHTLRNVLRLPWTIVAVTHPVEFTTALGIGALAFLAALRARGTARILLSAALAGAAVALALGQLTPRSFLEAYFWAGAAMVAAPWGRAKRLIQRALIVQCALTALVAGVAAGRLFPGAWTWGTREAVMVRSSAGYAEALWLDRVLPAEAVVLGQLRSFAVSPRRFAVSDQVINDPAAVGDVRRLAALVRALGVDTILLSRNDKQSFMDLTARCARPVSRPTEFPLAARNPFNKLGYTVTIFHLQGCPELLSPAAPR